MTPARPYLVALLVLFILLSEAGLGQAPSALAASPDLRESSAAAPGPVISHVQTRRKLLALTFDDGPNPLYTPQILDLLKQYHAHATFFVLGVRAKEYPQILRREIQEGHEIANHSYHHLYLGQLKPGQLQSEILDTQQAVYEATEFTPRLFRPPGGMYDQDMIRLARQDHLQVVTWSWYQDTRDWQKPGTGAIVRTVLQHTHGGDIVLFHDLTGDCRQTVEALRRILPVLKQEGYDLVTMTDLLRLSRLEGPKPVHHQQQSEEF